MNKINFVMITSTIVHVRGSPLKLNNTHCRMERPFMNTVVARISRFVISNDLFELKSSVSSRVRVATIDILKGTRDMC